MIDDVKPPGRGEVETIWRHLIVGVISRDEAHRWAVLWVEERWAEVSDPPTSSALQSLHGFDLTHDYDRPRVVRHGPGGCYVHSDERIVEAFNQWLEFCRRYDARHNGEGELADPSDPAPRA